jgi:hypothetical protein
MLGFCEGLVGCNGFQHVALGGGVQYKCLHKQSILSIVDVGHHCLSTSRNRATRSLYFYVVLYRVIIVKCIQVVQLEAA